MSQQDELYESQAPHILAIIITFPILGTIAVSLRLYTRLKILSNAAFDDVCVVIAMIFSILVSICMGYQVHFGMGRHIATLTQQEGLDSLKALFASIIVYNFGLLFTKLSILLQYLRICTSKPIKRACYAVMALIILYGVETLFTGVFTCIPVAFFWNPTIPGGTCVNKPALWFSNAGINIVTDFLLLILPIFILKGLMMPTRQKIGLSLVIALGGFACIASILRLHALYVVTVSEDITWDNPGTATWSAIELNVGIICTSIPTLKPLIRRFLPGFLGTTRSNNRAGYIYSKNHTGRQSSARKFSTLEGIEEISLRRDIEIGSSRKQSLSPSDVRDNNNENESYVIQGIGDSVHSSNKPSWPGRNDQNRKGGSQHAP